MVRNVTRSPPVGRVGVTVTVIVMAREGKGVQPNWVTSNEATGELRDKYDMSCSARYFCSTMAVACFPPATECTHILLRTSRTLRILRSMSRR